ncbi:MAG: TrpB-like pyridoxal phosphate-dependent enzyme, partial [Chloroflexota bacterium]
VYMVKVSYEQKPYRRNMMEVWGANCVPSPSPETNYGRKVLAEDPDCTGSLGIAISEAVEDAATRDDTHYSLGSVLNHVLLHQTVIGLEARKQMDMAGEYPDVLIGCMGGGSNFAGFTFPFIQDKLRGDKPKLRIVGVEPAACPTVTKGQYTFDFGDTAGMTPIVKMYTLGHDFVPAGIHAGGLRYHGMSAQVSGLYHAGVIEAQAYTQKPCFEAAVQFSRAEGIIPAPETSHAIRHAINEALEAKERGEKRVIAFNLSGHGHVDMAAYDAYFAGKLIDYEYPEEKVRESMAKIPHVSFAAA